MTIGVVYAGVLTQNTGITLAGAVALSLGIAIQNFPEGAIISMPLKSEGLSKPKAFLYGTLSGIVEPIAALITILLTLIFSIAAVIVLSISGDRNPVIDGITTVFSITGMYLTVRRSIEQWLVWIIVNGLSLIMWLEIALNGVKVYSTVIMWGVYFLLAIYFYIQWRMEIKLHPM